MLKLILALTLTINTAHAVKSTETLKAEAEFNRNVSLYKNAMRMLQPNLTDEEASELAKSFVYHATKLDLPKPIFLSILFQESSLRADPQNCAKYKNKCTGDYGIGQVNYRVWDKVLNLDKYKIMSSADEGIRVAALVLHRYKVRYTKEKQWFTRYYSGTPSLRARYYKWLRRHYDRIEIYLQGYSDGRQETGFTRNPQNLQSGQEEGLYFGVFEDALHCLGREPYKVC